MKSGLSWTAIGSAESHRIQISRPHALHQFFVHEASPAYNMYNKLKVKGEEDLVHLIMSLLYMYLVIIMSSDNVLVNMLPLILL